jgi:hypothetical protein
MFYDIVTNVGDEKKPWENVPIEVLIEEERKRKEAQEDKRDRLYAPHPMPPEHREPQDIDESNEDEEDFKIVIKL